MHCIKQTTHLEILTLKTRTAQQLLDRLKELASRSAPKPDVDYSEGKQILDEFKHLNHPLGLAESLYFLAYLHYQRAEYEFCRNHLHDSITQATKSISKEEETQKKDVILRATGLIGGTYARQGMLSLALPYYYEVLNTAEESGDYNRQSNYLSNIGTIHFINRSHKQALEFYLKAVKIKTEHQLHSHLDTLHNNIASCYIEQKQLHEAKKHLDKSMALAIDSKHEEGQAIVFLNYAGMVSKSGQFDEAIQYTRQALAIHKKTQNVEGIARCYLLKGEIYSESKQFEKSIQPLTDCLEIAEKAGIKELQERAYFTLSDVHKQLENFGEALAYMEKYAMVKEEITNEAQNKNLAELKLQYESEKKDLKIEQLRQQQQLLDIKNKELQSFASKASHDMKEPLRMISSFSTLLKKRYSEVLDEDAQDYLDFIQDANSRMTLLLENLLNFAIAGTSSNTVSSVDLNKSLKEVKMNLQLSIHETDTQITSSKLPKVQVNPTDVMQLLQNLISNAIKFCPGKPPEIHLNGTLEDGKYVISVADNGIGISAENKGKIFEPFSRLHARHEFQGTGIGLAICQKIVESYDGNIWVESEEGKGSTFYFTLPS